MAASQQQKVDFLLKKIGYTASKTGLAEDSSLSGTKKAPFAEAVPSPLVIANASVWAESNLIPATPPGTDSAQVKVYLSGTSGHRMTVDSTVSGNRSYIAYSTYNDNTSAILGDWIDTQFGSSYIVKVYKGDPNAGGTALSAAGSGSSDGWFFDYSSGILNFNDSNVPSGVTDTNIYIVAYRYIGKKGVITAGAASSVTTLDVSGISTFSGGVTIGGGATVTSNLTVTGGQTTVVNLNVTGVTTFVNSIYDEGNLDVDGKTDLDDLSVSGVSTFSALVDADSGIDVTGHSELDNVNVSGVLTAASFSGGSGGGTTIGEDVATRNLSVSTGSTFTGAIDANGGVDISGGSGLNVVGHTEVDNVNVSGVITAAQFSSDTTTIGQDIATRNLSVSTGSTFTGAIDANGGVDISGGSGLNVTGHTEVDYVNVSAAATFAGAIDANGGLDVSGGEATLASATVSDLTAGRITYAGTDGALQDNTKLTFVADKLGVTGGVEVTGVSTFGGAIDGNGGADISGGETTLSSATVSDLTSGRLTVAGTSGALQDSGNLTFVADKLGVTGGIEVSAGATFTGNIDADGDLDVDGHTELDYVNVSAAATFAGAIDANAGLDVSGGETTLSSATVSDLTDNRIVLAGTSGALQDSSKITFDGTTLAIVGDATFTGNVSVAGTLTSEDKTELDVIGIVTARSGVRVNSGGLVVSSGVVTTTDAIDANGGLDVSGGSGLVASTVKVSDLTSGRVVVAGTSGELEDASTFTVSGGTVSATAFSATNLTGTLQTAAQTNVTSVGTLTGLDVGGHSELDYVNVSAAATIAGAVDINGGADISGGETTLSSATVSDLTSGRLTYAGASGALQDSTNLTFNGTTLTSAGLDIGGHSELDYVNVSAAATIAGAIDGNGGANFSGGETVISSATVSDLTEGRVTFAGVSGALQDSGNLTFDGTTLTAANFDGGGIGGISTTGSSNFNIIVIDSGLNVVSGVSTFQGNIDANGDISIAGNAGIGSVDVTGILTAASLVAGGSGGVTVGANNDLNSATFRVSGIATFNGAIDANGDLDVDGHTELDYVNVSAAATIDGNLHLKDNDKLRLGSSLGANTLDIYNSSSVGYIQQNGTDALGIYAQTLNLSDPVGGKYIVCNRDSDVEIYFDDAKKIETAQTGAIVTGLLTATTFSGAFEGSTVTASGDINANGNIIGDSATNISGMNNISGTSLNGTVATSAQPNITSLGSLTGLVVGGWSDLDDVYVSGVTTFFSDVVVADTIRHDGDDNTKIRFNGGDTLTIETNSAERLRVVKGGGVGIGTTNPSAAVTSANTATLAVGILTAYQLYGDGSNLSGVGFEPTTGDTGTGNLYAGTEAGNASDTDTYCNVAIGYRAGKALNSGDQNVFLGTNAGCTATAAGNNVFIGNLTGQNLLDTSSNVFVGNASGKCNRGDGNIAMGNEAFLGGSATPADNTGSHNVTLGTFAGKTITTGAENIFLGCGAGGTAAVTADHNIGLGVEAGRKLTSGAENVHIGYKPAAEQSTGSGNVYIGKETAEQRESGDDNIAIGSKSLYGDSTPANNTGSNNISIGKESAKSLTSGYQNVFIGCKAGYYSVGNAYSVFIGNSAGYHNDSGNDNVFIGNYTGCGSVSGTINAGCNAAIVYGAGRNLTTGTFNTFMGKDAGTCISTGSENIAFGCSALTGSSTPGNNTGDYNIAIGKGSGLSVTSGSNNILIGQAAGDALTSGSGAVAIGCAALSTEDTKSYAVAIGWQALTTQNADFGNNVAVGYCAGATLTNATENVFMGYESGKGVTTGTGNVAIGAKTLDATTTGGGNVAIGQDSLRNNTGDNNVAIGAAAGDAAGDGTDNVFVGKGSGSDNTDGDKNTFLGRLSGNTNTTGCCNIAIGHNVELPSITGNHQLAIGVSGNRWITGDSSFNLGLAGGSVLVTNAAAGVGATIGPGDAGVTTYFGDGSNLTGVTAGFEADADLNLMSSGTCSGCSLDGSAGCFNTLLGACAGKSLTAGYSNILIGCHAGCSLTDGYRNIIIGDRESTTPGTSGYANVFLGWNAGRCGTSGNLNVMLGCEAGQCMTGDHNFVVGYRAGSGATGADDEVLIGRDAGCLIGAGSNNVFIGCKAGTSSGTPGDNDASSNVAIGVQAGNALTDGDQNVFLGKEAGLAVTTGCENVFLGQSSGANITTANSSVFIGESTGKCIQTGAHNLAMGSAALMGSSTPADNTGSCNIGIGKGAGACMTTAGSNVLIGCKAGNQITEGTGNVALGPLALGSGLTTGVCNIAIGLAAAACQSTGSDNIAIGQAALTGSSTPGNNTGSNNIAIGKGSGYSITTANKNVFIGECSGYSATTNGDNVIIGACAGKLGNPYISVHIGMQAGQGVAGCSSAENVFIGCKSGMDIQTGSLNAFVGGTSGCDITTGHCNAVLGAKAAMTLNTGSQNTFLGSYGGNNVTSGSCNVAVGFNVDLPSATADKQMAVGIATSRWITGYTDFSIGGVFKNYAETFSAMGNTGGTPTIDLADGNVFSATLNDNATFTFTMGLNLPQTATSFTLILTNDSTPSRTISWPASVKWPNNSVPSRTTAASKTDIWSFMTPDGGATWYGNIALYNFT